jgi:two-component system, sensor histidine kinase and response regulator
MKMPEGAIRVLIIDDEEAMRDSCAQILRRSGYEVDTAPDGAAGIRKIADLRPDAIIVDLKMPGTSGLEVLDSLPAVDPHIAAIVITGYATIDTAVEAMKRGACDFLPKPFTPQELRIILTRGLERRRLVLETESLRREKKALEENFITLVSHQLRSPLVAVRQYFEVILAGLAGHPDPDMTEMIQRAGDRLDGLLRLINDWLDIARLEQKSPLDRFKAFDAAALLARVVQSLTPVVRDAGLSLEWAPPAGPGPILQGDEESLEQALANLIHNAVQYNRPHGRVRVALHEEPDTVRIEVEDSGIGIAAKHIPFLFERFYRVGGGEGGKPKGSGLGLAIVKAIVDAHGGRIDVRSKPGVGTVFFIRLPKPRPGDTSA